MPNLHTHTQHTFISDSFWIVKFCSLSGEGRRQGMETLFRNIQNTGIRHYSALSSRRGSYVLVGSYLLILLLSWVEGVGKLGLRME